MSDAMASSVNSTTSSMLFDQVPQPKGKDKSRQKRFMLNANNKGTDQPDQGLCYLLPRNFKV